jgi:N-acyl-D-aspartate/D-glutamate deacylase
MRLRETIIRNASVFDGAGAEAETADVALRGDCILAIGRSLELNGEHEGAKRSESSEESAGKTVSEETKGWE